MTSTFKDYIKGKYPVCEMPFVVKKYQMLLFISYEFVKGFLAITFLLLVISSLNFYNVCQRFFLYKQDQHFSLIRRKTKNFPIDPIIKIAHFCNVMSIDMTLQKWAIFIMGSVGKFLIFCRIKLKFRPWLYKKR